MSNDILVRDRMTDSFVSLSGDLSVTTAQLQMQNSQTTFGLIQDVTGELPRVVTGERLLTLQQTLGTDAESMPLSQAADALPPALFVSDDLPLEEVLEWPRLKELTDTDSVLICMYKQKPVGILSSASLFTYIAVDGLPSASRFAFDMLLPGTPNSRPIEVVCTVCQTKNQVIRVDPAAFCSNDKAPYGLHHLKS